MRCAWVGLVVMGCGGEGAMVGGVDAVGGDAVDAGVDGDAVDGLVMTAVAFADVPTSFDVVRDVTGDGRDDVVMRYFNRADGPEVVIARLDGAGLVRVGAIEAGAAELMGPKVMVEDVRGDAAPELLLAGAFEGMLYGFATPLAGDRVLGDAVLALEGPRNSFFATMHTRGGLLAGGEDALVIATPGEPEEACFSGQPPVLLGRPLPASGEVVSVAAARFTPGDPFDCPGVWLVGDRDWTGDGVDDLIVASRGGGGRLFAGPIEDGRAFTSGVALAVGTGPYGGYGVAGGAVVDSDGDGVLELGLVDVATGALRLWPAPIDAARSSELALGAAGAVLVDGPRPADLDADGDADLVVLDDMFAPTRVMAITLPGGGRAVSARTLTRARTGDLDGDGRTEILALDSAGFYLLRLP